MILRAAVCLALFLLHGCTSITLTAKNSINPVMFGPRKSLGTEAVAQVPSGADRGTPFIHRVNTYATAAIGMGGMLGFGGSSTNPPPEEQGYSDWADNRLEGDSPRQMDWKVLRATKEDPSRRVDLESIRCRGFNFNTLMVFMLKISCEVEGVSPPAR